MHTLVVGGTGMLAGVTRWLAEQGHIVSVVSKRGTEAHSGMMHKMINPVVADYRDSDGLRVGVDEAISMHGPIGLAVFWIHTDAPEAFRVIADEISDHAETPWRLFHVRGSAAHLHLEPPQVLPNCLYRQIILGFVTEGNGSRWLTHDEISGGVLDAIRSDRDRTVVGMLEPWEMRPV